MAMLVLKYTIEKLKELSGQICKKPSSMLLQFSFSFLIYFSFPSFLIATIGEAVPL